jgi:hypothetical protein
MRQRYAILIFLTALLILCAGAYAAGRLFLPAGPAEFRPQPGWTPSGATPAGQAGVAPTIRVNTTPHAPGPTATFTPRATPALAHSPVAPTAPPAQTSSPTPTATATETPASEATAAAFAFELARPVRHSAGDCPGSYVLGLVTDPAGRPLPDVRLVLADEWGNSARTVSKSVAGEMGRYDFPLFSRQRYFLTLVDVVGRPLSAQIEIAHGVGANAPETCHWVDWQQR